MTRWCWARPGSGRAAGNGDGTIGGGRQSNQTRLGTSPFVKLLADGYNENGLRFFDWRTPTEPPVCARGLEGAAAGQGDGADEDGYAEPGGGEGRYRPFRRELGVDHIDVVLIHCVTEADWTTRYRGVMDVLSEAKEKGVIRAHGDSCHSLVALKAAAASPWVEVDLVRLNPIGSHMDADPATVISVIKEMRRRVLGLWA